MTRSWPCPPADRTLHAVGDVQGAPLTRLDPIVDDVQRDTVPHVTDRVYLGDCTADGSPSDDAYFLAFKARMSGNNHVVIGNHDIVGPRTAATAAAALGAPGKDYVVDLGYAALIVIGPDVTNGYLIYRATTMDWVDTQLQAHSDKPCIIAAHAPLMNTVQTALYPDSTPGSESTVGPWYAMGESAYLDWATGKHDDDIRAVLADNANAKVWLSGHIHSPITTTPDMRKVETVGGHTIACIDTSSLLPSGYNHLGQTAPVASPFLTFYDERLEVRWRDHGAHQWIGVSTGREKVWTYDL